MDDREFAPVPESEQVTDDTLKNLTGNKGEEE